MTQTISRLYDSYDRALLAVRALKDAGLSDREISIVASEATAHVSHPEMESATAEDASAGAGIGGIAGVAAGLLAGLGIIAIPGIGPVVAAGWLASTVAVGAAGAVAGGAAGGIIGALTSSGLPEEDAHVYAESIRRGDTLVTVQVPDDRELEVTRVLSRFPPVNPALRADAYREAGWDRFDEAGEPYRPAPDETALGSRRPPAI
jgi:hypothetical protein